MWLGFFFLIEVRLCYNILQMTKVLKICKLQGRYLRAHDRHFLTKAINRSL